VIEVLLGAALFAVVAAFVLRPLLAARHGPGGGDPGFEARLADLEARKEAKYREIRDAQLDHAAGKLSDEDFRRQEGELRAEAAAILADLDELRGRSP
jgi:hypothetical protein